MPEGKSGDPLLDHEKDPAMKVGTGDTPCIPSELRNGDCSPPLPSKFSKDPMSSNEDDNEHKAENKNAAENGHTSDGGSVDQCGEEKGKMEDESAADADVCADDEEHLLLIQDAGFNVKVVVPGMEPFDLPVLGMELVQEVYQVLIDREDTVHRTCFSLQLDGVVLDNFADLKSIEGLTDGSVLKVVEEPYTVREARIHVRHVRDLLKSIDNADAYNGAECTSLSFLNTITSGDILDKKVSKPEHVDCTPPEYIMPGSKDRPQLPLYLNNKDMKSPQCLKVFTYSGWNPPPGNRKMHGDLLYLYIVTLEEKRFHITACTLGFYVNQSSLDEFNPRASQGTHLCHSLIDLLNQISPAFKRNFALLLKKRSEKHPFERVVTPYQIYTWMAPVMEHTVDYIRAEDAFSARLGYEEHIPGQTRDWNEELQTTRELPRKTLTDRLVRERAIFKVHSDFVVAATRGAMAVVDGNIMAINPGEDAKMQMFLWNNIFFSLGFDVKDHYKDFGGDAAAYAAPANDLQGVRAYSGVDLEGLYTLGTVVVDYRGYRVTAQSIIPGILEREQEQSVVYGSIDFGKTIVSNDKYREILKKTAAALKIREHKIVSDKGDEVELFSSVECKGILGNDGRHYVLDLLRTFPPDVNFLPVEDGEELSGAMKAKGFPRAHRHRIVCLRQELIDSFIETRYMMYVKQAAVQFQQLRFKKLAEEQQLLKEKQESESQGSKDSAKSEAEKQETEEPEVAGKLGKVKDETGEDTTTSEESTTPETTPETEASPESEPGQVNDNAATAVTETENAKEELGTDEVKKLVEGIISEGESTEAGDEDNSKDIVKRAASLVGSLSDTEFNITFNPDVFQPHVNHANTESEIFKKEKQLVKDAAEYLVQNQIPGFVRDCMEHTSSPIDGYTLSEAMHHNGINMRYLGNVTEIVGKYSQLSYLHSVCHSELLTRVAKHLFKAYMQGLGMMSLSSAVSHFLSCFLGSYQTPHAAVAKDELQSQKARKRNKKKNKGYLSLTSDNTEWASETPKSLWKKIQEEMKSYFAYEMDCDCIDSAVEKYTLQKISMLRLFCKKTGVQILLREYSMDNKHKQAFQEEDIINIFPIVKNIHPKASDAYHIFTSGQNKIQQGLLRDGYELISEALNLLNNVYGAMHPEIAACCRLLARLNYIMGEYAEALSYQQRAVMMSERVMGIDHPNTITEYAHLALYCFANNQVSSALKLMYRARYLILLCHGEYHPEVALFDSNIGLILHAVGEFDLSLRFFINALELNSKFYGAKSLKVAMNYHLVARAHSCKGDFRTALQNEKEAYTVYKQLLGEEHERTKESSECLKHLTQQAVKFQKTMNEIYKGEKGLSIPPIQIHTPSKSNVLETLNLINGIVFLHISQDDIEKFREEMVRRQAQQQVALSQAGQKAIIEAQTKGKQNGQSSPTEGSDNPNAESTENSDTSSQTTTVENEVKSSQSAEVDIKVT